MLVFGSLFGLGLLFGSFIGISSVFLFGSLSGFGMSLFGSGSVFFFGS